MLTDRLPNPVVDVEAELSKAIAKLRGVRVDALIGKTDKKNADFLFDDFAAIAELKVLEVDQIQTERFVSKCSVIYERYLKEGRAPVRVFGTARLKTDAFPEEFRREIADLYSVPLRRVIKSADEQIGSTMRLLDRHGYSGVLILVNDGNTALGPSHIVWCLGEHLRDGQFKNICGVIFFTVNMAMKNDTRLMGSIGVPHDMDLHVWYEGGRRDTPSVHPAFMSALRSAWFEHLSVIVGRVAEVHGSKELLHTLENADRVDVGR